MGQLSADSFSTETLRFLSPSFWLKLVPWCDNVHGMRHIIYACSSPLNFRSFIGLNWSRDPIIFIYGETLSVLKPSAKRLQHANTTCCIIVGRNMLRAFDHLVAMCSDTLGVVGSKLTILKFEKITLNMSQHVATRWPNTRNMLRRTMLGHVVLACCDRLAGALQSIK